MTADKYRVEIRRATPADVKDAARLIRLSGPSIHDRMFGGDKEAALEAISHIFSMKGALFSFDNAVVAIVGEKTAGLMISYDKEQASVQGKRYGAEIFKVMPLRCYPFAIAHRLLIRRVVKPLQKGSLCGGMIAVYPEFRGSGVGLAMLCELERQAVDGGYRRIEADMEIDNDNARRIYEKFGFEFTEIRRAGLFAGLLGMRGFQRIVKNYR